MGPFNQISVLLTRKNTLHGNLRRNSTALEMASDSAPTVTGANVGGSNSSDEHRSVHIKVNLNNANFCLGKHYQRSVCIR